MEIPEKVELISYLKGRVCPKVANEPPATLIGYIVTLTAGPPFSPHPIKGTPILKYMRDPQTASRCLPRYMVGLHGKLISIVHFEVT